jgi:hypothetical protein
MLHWKLLILVALLLPAILLRAQNPSSPTAKGETSSKAATSPAE